jgi:hypothetical protein
MMPQFALTLDYHKPSRLPRHLPNYMKFRPSRVVNNFLTA